VAYGLSFFSDLVAIIIVRKTLGRLATNLSVLRLIGAISFLAALAGTLEFGPLLFHSRFVSADLSAGTRALIRAQAPILQRLNLSSSIFCLAPLLFSLVVLGHKLIWPILGRLVYPVASRKLITNRKLLFSIASLAILYLLNDEPITLKALMGLLGNSSE
jgi:hypothetical protein